MSFDLKDYNIKIFLHLFLRLHPFSFIGMFVSIAFKWYRSDDESCEGTNTKDPTVDFEREASWAEDEEDEDIGFFLELERIVTQEDREKKLHSEETEIVNLGVGDGKKEVKMGMGMTTPIREELVALLRTTKMSLLGHTKTCLVWAAILCSIGCLWTPVVPRWNKS